MHNLISHNSKVHSNDPIQTPEFKVLQFGVQQHLILSQSCTLFAPRNFAAGGRGTTGDISCDISTCPQSQLYLEICWFGSFWESPAFANKLLPTTLHSFNSNTSTYLQIKWKWKSGHNQSYHRYKPDAQGTILQP